MSSLLRSKQAVTGVTVDSAIALSSGSYSLLADRPLRCLWTYTSHLKKHGRQFGEDTALSSPPELDCSEKRPRDSERDEGGAPDTSPYTDCPVLTTVPVSYPSFCSLFTDPSLPLVVDVGCGFGATIIGLCSEQLKKISPTDVESFNFLGCDMSATSILYASGIAERWGLRGQCAFLVSEGLSCLQWIKSEYPGLVDWILLQFPTPFAFSVISGDGGM